MLVVALDSAEEVGERSPQKLITIHDAESMEHTAQPSNSKHNTTGGSAKQRGVGCKHTSDVEPQAWTSTGWLVHHGYQRKCDCMAHTTLQRQHTNTRSECYVHREYLDVLRGTNDGRLYNIT